MNIIKRNGGTARQLPSLFDDFFNRDLFDWRVSNFSNSDTTVPAVNIKETANSYEVQMAAPGMAKEDFKVELDGNLLTISAEKSNESEEKKDDSKYSRKEYSYESFQRSFTLSKDVVDEDKINARYEDGVLYLVIPKKEEAKQKTPRQIQVS